MSSTLESFFGKRIIADNQGYLQERFVNQEALDFTFPPKTIDIHLGYKGKPCSLNCVWCFDQTEETNKPIPWTLERINQFRLEIDKVIDWQKNGFKVEDIYLAGGGEPSLYPEVASMVVNMFSGAGRHVWLTTNGVRINEPLFSTMLEKGKGVLVSMPGANRQSYHQNGGFDYFEKVIRTLEEMTAARTDQGSSLEINVTHVLMPNTIAHLEELILRLDQLGINEFRIRYDIFSDHMAEQNVKGIEEVRRILQTHPELETKVILKSPQEEGLPEDMKCFSPFLWPTWNPLHGVFPCAHATNEGNQINSQVTNGVYSLVDMEASQIEATCPDCHRRCPSSIHWFNLYLNQAAY